MDRRRPLFLLFSLIAALALVGAGCGGGDDDEGDAGGEQASDQAITFAWGAEPPSLDPGLATDTTSANILINIMDQLVKLEGADQTPKPNLAESWEESQGGKVITFHLRDDGKW